MKIGIKKNNKRLEACPPKRSERRKGIQKGTGRDTAERMKRRRQRKVTTVRAIQQQHVGPALTILNGICSIFPAVLCCKNSIGNDDAEEESDNDDDGDDGHDGGVTASADGVCALLLLGDVFATKC